MADESSSSPDDVCRQVAALALRQRPTATRCRIIIDFADGEGESLRDTISVPLASSTDGLEAVILTALGKMKPGEWMRGKTLCRGRSKSEARGGAKVRR